MRALITQETAKFVLSLLELQRTNPCLDIATGDKAIQDHVYNLDKSIRELKNAIKTTETTIDVIAWDEADLKETFEKHGIGVTGENIQTFKGRGSDWFHSIQIEQAWDILDTIVADMKDGDYFDTKTSDKK